ncbi:MAG: hypothetical protein ACK5LO_05910 [Leucobacter sp.]
MAQPGTAPEQPRSGVLQDESGQRGKRRVLPWVIAGAGAAVVVAALVAVLVLRPWASGFSIEDRLALFAEPSDSSFFTVSIGDPIRQEQAAGEDLPVDGSVSDYKKWLAVMERHEDGWDAELSDEEVGGSFEASKMARRSDGYVFFSADSGDKYLWYTAFAKPFSEGEVEEYLGKAEDGVWTDDLHREYGLRDDVLYAVPEEGDYELPKAVPAREDSLAADEKLVDFLQTLYDTGAYHVSASKSDSSFRGVAELSKKTVEDFTLTGNGIAIRDGDPELTFLFEHSSAQKAESNADAIEQALKIVLENLEQPSEVTVRVDGTRVFAEFPFEVDEGGLSATASEIIIYLSTGSNSY